MGVVCIKEGQSVCDLKRIDTIPKLQKHNLSLSESFIKMNTIIKVK